MTAAVVRTSGTLARGVLAALLAAGIGGFAMTAHAAGGEDGVRAEAVPAPARERQLIQLVRHDCGSCHGLTLAGGLGPALLPPALRDKPVEYLAALILHGRPGTAMPGWQGLLSQQDAHWIATRLREGFPDER